MSCIYCRFNYFATGINVTGSINSIEFVTVMGRVPHSVDQTEFREVVVLELIEVAGDDGDVVEAGVVDLVEGSLEIVDLLSVSIRTSG